MTFVLFDIGGTKTRVAVSEDLKTFTAHKSFKTPKKFEEGVEAIAVTARELSKGPFRGVSGGIRGVLS
jgi:predicted NBD/HSP70 family sugar kinase